MKRKHFIIALMAMLSCFAFTAKAQNVAKVGNTEYATIDEAISAWTNGTTLTLLSDVTLSDVIMLSSTEYHILDLGTYTMTAKKGSGTLGFLSNKDAIEIVNNGRSSASYALDIKADATNPGGITTNKAVVKTTGKSGVKDRPIIRFYGGVFNGSNVVSHSGSNGTNCPQFWFYGGEFNGTVYANRAKFIFYGGTFNGSLQMSVDSSADALVVGGKFKQLSNLYGSTLNTDKFTIGSAAGVYDRGIYVDKDGYYVITSAPIKEVSAKYPAVKKESYNSNNYFYYSAAATYGMFYEDASMAGTGSNVTLWEPVKAPAVEEVAPENATEEEKAVVEDVIEEVTNNAAVKNNTVELPAEVIDFTIELAKVEVAEGTTPEAPATVVTELSYTVTPSNAAGEKVSKPSEPITFRLPLPSNWASEKVKVIYNGNALDGDYTVMTENGAKYVEVESQSFSTYTVQAIVPLFAGEGTEASPYIIDSSAKLAALSNSVNGGEAYAGVYFKLTSDITLSGEWTAIGKGSRSSKSYTGNAFKGVFDGDNNTISGLTITSTTGADAAIGLFGVVDGGTVKNLNLEVNINVANSNLAGGAIGMMLNGATAENITINGAIVGNDGVGGIAGRLVIDGTIANCTNNASVTSSYGGIGGIVGKAYYEDGANTATFASITNCTNKGTIKAPMYVGGIAGLARANVSGCINEGAIEAGTQTGGILGQLMAAGTVSGNENKAKVTGTSHVGGIIGDYTQSGSYTYNNVSIANNTNRGEISATGDCAAILGCNNVDGFTAMTATGNVSYYFVEGLALFGNPEDMTIDATNKFLIPVAKLGEVEYFTISEAVAAAQDGDEIVLIADVKTTDGVVITDKNLTIDLNGKTYTVTEGASTNNRNFKINGTSVVTVKNGTMVAAGEYSSGAYGTVRTEGTATATLTGLKLYNYRGNGLNIKACAGTTVTVENTEIYANYGGGIEAAGGTIVVNDGVIVEQKGMYTAPYNSMAISVNGGGKVTVNGGTFSTECITAEEANNQGTSHGPWVAGVLNSGGTLIINGGTFSNDNFGENSLATYARGAILADTKAKVEINGGTFNVLKNVIDIQNNLGDTNNNPSVLLVGGTYSADPRISAQYGSNLITLAEDYIAVENNGVWTIVEAPAYIEGKASYVSLAAAYEAAVNGDVIVLNESVTTFPVINKAVTFKGGKENAAVEINVFLAQNFTAIDGTVRFENLTFNKPLFTEQGGTKPGLTIEFEGCNFNVPSDQGYAILIGTSWSNSVVKGLKVNNCNFKYVGTEFKGGYMLYVQCVNEVTITNNTIDGNNLYRGAIHLGDATEHATVATVSNNTIKNFCRGVMMGNRVAGSSATISGNTFDNINYSDKDSKPAQECAPIFIHSNATAEALQIALTNNEVENCANPMIYSEDTDLIKYYVTEFTGNTVDGTAVELANSYNAPNQVFPVATINDAEYFTLQAAINAVQEGETITILAGTISEGTIKLPATLKNVTIKGAASVARSTEETILKDMTISAADGNSYSYVGLTFDGITFDNSRLLFTGWRNGDETIENLTVTNCTFKNLYDTTNTAPIHINKDAAEAVNGFTFTNNVIDGATGGQKSGIYAQVTGNVVVSGNVINNVSFRPYVIQVTTDDGVADNFTVAGNTFSGSAVGRAQGLGSNDAGTDNVNLVVSNNIFKGITDSQQICYWSFNAEKTTADLSKNYYDIDILANPSRIYYNSAAANTADLTSMGVFPIYTELNEDGTIKTESAYYPPVVMMGENGYQSVEDALAAAKAENLTEVVITIVGENTATTADKFNLYQKSIFDKVTFKQENGNKPYYFEELYTGSRINNGKFVFDGVNIAVTANGQYILEGNVVLSNNSYIKSNAEANCFVYNAEVTVEAGSKIDGVIEDIRGGSLIIDGGKTDGTYCEEPALRDAILNVNWATSNLVLKNGAYVKVNAANEVGRLTVNGKVDVSNSKLESYQYIAVNQGATFTLNAGSVITTKELTGVGVINVDAEGMTAGDVVNLTADLSKFTGTLSVINNDKLEAKIVDGKIVLVAKPVAKIGDTYYATLAEAIAASSGSGWGSNVTLLKDITLEGGYADAGEGLRIEKSVTIDGAGHTIDCGIFTKGIRIYQNADQASNVMFKNINIVNNNAKGRCIDTRSGKINLMLNGFVNLTAHGTNSQPLTIGGSEAMTKVTISGGTIDAGTSGYAVICFVPVTNHINVQGNAVIKGLGAFYLKEGVTNTAIKLTQATCIGTNVNAAASGDFGAIVIEGSNNSVRLEHSDAVVKAVAGDGAEMAAQAAFLLRGNNNTVGYYNADAQVVTEGGQAYWTLSDADVTGTKYERNGVEMLLEAETCGYQFITVEDALRYAKDGDTVKLLANAELDETYVNEKSLTLDLNGKTLSTAYVAGSTTNHLYAIHNYAELTITDSSDAKDGKISARGNFNYGKLTLKAGTIEAVDHNGGYAVRNYAGAEFVMDGGAVVTTNENGDAPESGNYDATSLRVDADAKATINAGTITNVSNYTFAIDNNGEVTVNGGTVTSVHSTVSNYGTATINGGSFTCNGLEGITAHVIVAWDGSTTTINGGTFDGKDNYNGFNVDAEEGANVVIKGGNFLAVHSGSLYGKGTITVSAGTFFDKIDDARCVVGFQAVANENGTYTVEYTGCRNAMTIVDGEVTEFVNANEIAVGALTYKRTFSDEALNNFQPLYLPFEIPVSELLEKYDVAYINDFRETFDANGNIVEGKEVIELVLIKSGTLKANHPYVIRPKSEEALNWELVLNETKLHSTNGKNYSVECSSATKVFTFKGIYKKTTRAELAGDEVTPVYVMSKSGSMGTLKNPTSALGAFRFYMMKSNKDGSPYIEDVSDESRVVRFEVIGEKNENGETIIYDVVGTEQKSEAIFDLQGRRVLTPVKGNLYIINGKKVVY